jgi:hypothetical protein
MRLVLLSILALSCSGAFAQKLYRCGNQYQDRPCEAGGGQIISNKSVPKALPKGVDPVCYKRGELAEELATKLTGGATSEQLFAEIDQKSTAYEDKLSQKKLVVDIVQRKVSPAEQRVLAEADCVALRGVVPEAVVPTVPLESAEDRLRRAEEQQVRQEAAETKAQQQQQKICAGFDRQLASIRSSQRSGGSGSAMDDLNRQAREIDLRRAEAGC